MYATDLSAVLPPHDRQIYDTLTLRAIQIIKDRQAADLANFMARTAPKRPVGDRHRVG